jgi:RNA polymerase sigma-70 factor (ECF subfamily)
MSDDPEDEERLRSLMMAYQAGELEAFRCLYDRLYPDLRRYLASARRDGTSLEDLLQDTFLEMHRSRRTYLPPLPVRPWIFGIARNVIRRHRRLRLRRLTREDSWNDVIEQSTWRGAAVRVGYTELDEALRQVPLQRRRVWQLHHQHGFSFKEIAAMLGIGVNAAKLRASRAMSTLRGLLGVARHDRYTGER